MLASEEMGRGRMDWKLELVSVPVADVDRAKAFYRSEEHTSELQSPI